MFHRKSLPLPSRVDWIHGRRKIEHEDDALSPRQVNGLRTASRYCSQWIASCNALRAFLPPRLLHRLVFGGGHGRLDRALAAQEKQKPQPCFIAESSRGITFSPQCHLVLLASRRRSRYFPILFLRPIFIVKLLCSLIFGPLPHVNSEQWRAGVCLQGLCAAKRRKLLRRRHL